MFDPAALEVYVVTSAAFGPGRDHRTVTHAAIEGGATAVQLRAPELDDDALLPLASELAEACRAADVLFIVNDRLDVALESGAAGVHLGQDDDPRVARRRLGAHRVLGVSVGTVDEAMAAEHAGADYLGVTVWSSPTKPDAVARGLEGLGEVVEITTLPVVGIGGIFASNATLVLEAGAAGIAVISAVAASADPVAAVGALVGVVERFRATHGAVRR
ncbi:MAG: thiamine phosphate synthase [Actinomycetota bacterium]